MPSGVLILKTTVGSPASFPEYLVSESECNDISGSGYWSAFEIKVQPARRFTLKCSQGVELLAFLTTDLQCGGVGHMVGRIGQ